MKTLKTIFTNKELKTKIFLTILVLAIFKIGTMIKIPTVGNLSYDFNGGFLATMNYLSGSYLGKFTLFSLGLSPYITSSIIVQLLGMGVIKSLERWKEEGEAGKKKTDKVTFILATILSIFEAIILVWSFDANYNVLKVKGIVGYASTSLILIAGSIITMLLSKIIDKKGIGNGASLIIFAGIASRIGYDIFFTAQSILNYKEGLKTSIVSTSCFVLYLLFFTIIVGLIVLFDKSVKKIKVQFARQNNELKENNSNIPIKVNIGGVIPVIFTVSIMTGLTFTGILLKNTLLKNIGDYTNIPGIFVYVCLILFFTSFYATEIFNAKTIAKNLKKGNSVVVGKLPGKETEKYLEQTIKDMSIIGGIALAFIAVIPILSSAILEQYFKLDLNLALGGTSIMIVAGVACETVEQIKAKIKTIKSTKLRLFD